MGSRAPSTLMAGQRGHRMQEVQGGTDCARCDANPIVQGAEPSATEDEAIGAYTTGVAW